MFDGLDEDLNEGDEAAEQVVAQEKQHQDEMEEAEKEQRKKEQEEFERQMKEGNAGGQGQVLDLGVISRGGAAAQGGNRGGYMGMGFSVDDLG